MKLKDYLYEEINLIDVVAVFIILTIATLFQILFHELPCPLCFLQRFGFFLIGIGFLFNLRFGTRPSHYALSMLGALYTACVAGRQVLLHIVPGTGAYGSPFLGLHLYTWVFIAAVMFVLWISFQLMLEKQFHLSRWFMLKSSKAFRAGIHAAFTIMIGLALINIVSVFLQCGTSSCPEEPQHYKYFFSFNQIEKE